MALLFIRIASLSLPSLLFHLSFLHTDIHSLLASPFSSFYVDSTYLFVQICWPTCRSTSTRTVTCLCITHVPLCPLLDSFIIKKWGQLTGLLVCFDLVQCSEMGSEISVCLILPPAPNTSKARRRHQASCVQCELCAGTKRERGGGVGFRFSARSRKQGTKSEMRGYMSGDITTAFTQSNPTGWKCISKSNTLK